MPSGASTGEREALELRDGDKADTAAKACATPSRTSTARSPSALVGRSFTQRSLDEAMIALDGTPTKSRLGANALLGVSMAAARAGAPRSAACRSTGTSATLYRATTRCHAAPCR